jgi:hypothetical protein
MFKKKSKKPDPKTEKNYKCLLMTLKKVNRLAPKLDIRMKEDSKCSQTIKHTWKKNQEINARCNSMLNLTKWKNK